jgi:hypothetical protein
LGFTDQGERKPQILSPNYIATPGGQILYLAPNVDFDPFEELLRTDNLKQTVLMLENLDLATYDLFEQASNYFLAKSDHLKSFQLYCLTGRFDIQFVIENYVD